MDKLDDQLVRYITAFIRQIDQLSGSITYLWNFVFNGFIFLNFVENQFLNLNYVKSMFLSQNLSNHVLSRELGA